MLKNKKLAVIGVGKLGEALIAGLIKNGDLKADDITGSVKQETSLNRVREKLSIEATLDNRAIVESADINILAVKPQNMDKVISDMADLIRTDQLVISVAASVSSAFVEQRLKGEVPV
ncbi:MAG: NAD(P)-binding domain-containing protein, partial [Candidatus Obscuribacterales bacterium]|nr:NAD(P)-binding domain-containing protein [Candidatus Obscuribacterales bacterium]